MTLDAAVLSDDHVAQRYGGFFTGAFVGLVAVDFRYGKKPFSAISITWKYDDARRLS